MPGPPTRPSNSNSISTVDRLFGSSNSAGRGTVAGLTEEQLLDRVVASKDDAAFEALVRLHGKAVMSVCRRLLPDPAAADDAFQATFIVLSRKAGSLRRSKPLAPWLVGVAYRIASKARVAAARRQAHESAAASRRPEAIAPLDPVTFDLAPILWEELHRLPGKYRDPIVLCWVQGLSLADAADRLRWPVGTVKGRLHRARETLRARLSRRGITAPAAGLASWFSAESAQAITAPPLITATVKLAVATATSLIAGTVPAGSLLLAHGALRAMQLKALTTACAALTLVGGLGGVAVLEATTGTPLGWQRQVNAHGAEPPTIPTNSTQATNTAISDEDSSNPTLDPRMMDGNGVLDPFGLEADELRALHKQLKLEADAEIASRFQAVRQFLIDAKAEAGSKPESRAQSLHQSLINAASENVRLHHEAFRVANIPPERYLAALQTLFEARLVGASNQDERIAALQEYRDQLTDLLEGKYVGLHSKVDLSLVQVALTRVELLLATATDPGSLAPTEVDEPDNSRSPAPGTNSSEPPDPPLQDDPRSGIERLPGHADASSTNGPALASTETGDPGDDPASLTVKKTLDQPISMEFQDGSTLGELVQFLRSSTESDEFPQGIPIFIDSTGLQKPRLDGFERPEVTLDTPIQLDLQSVPARTSLWLALWQLDLVYSIKEGVLIISTPERMEMLLNQEPVYRSQKGMGMGGMGGMGMMGGGMM